MADEKLNENQLPSNSDLNDINDSKLPNKNVTKKRTLSESEDQCEIDDQKVPNNTIHKIKKNKIYQDNQSSALDKRDSLIDTSDNYGNNFNIECSPDPHGAGNEQDLMLTMDSEVLPKSQTDAIKKLTRQIAHIENQFLTYKAFIGDTNKDSQNFANEEVEVLPEFSYNLDDEIIFDRKISNCHPNIVNIMSKKSISINETEDLLLEPPINDSKKNILENHKTILTETIENEINNIGQKSQIIQEKQFSESMEQIIDVKNNDIFFFEMNESKMCTSNLKSNFDHVEGLIDPITLIDDDVILLNRKVDKFISNSDKNNSIIITNQEEDRHKLKTSVLGDTVLDNEKNLSKIDDKNVYERKSIYGEEEKLSESIQYLEDKIVLRDINNIFVNEYKKYENLINQELSEPSHNLNNIVTLDDANIHTNKINHHQLSKSRDSINTDHTVLIKRTKHVDDMIMFGSENIDCCIIGEKEFISNSVVSDEQNCIDLTKNSNNEIMLKYNNDIINTFTNNETNVYDSCPDVPVININTTHSPKGFITKNCSRNSFSTDTEKMHNNSYFRIYSSDLGEKSIIGSHDSKNDTFLETDLIYKKSFSYKDEHLVENVAKQDIEDVIGSFDSSNSFLFESLNFSTAIAESLINGKETLSILSTNSSFELNVSFEQTEVKRSLENSNSDCEASDISLLFMPSNNDLLKYVFNSSDSEEEKLISKSPNDFFNMRSLENSNINCEASDISLLFMPSNNDLLKYVFNSSDSEEEKLISKSPNDFFNMINKNENISQEKLYLNTSKLLLKSSEEFNDMKVNVLKSSSFVKDFEDNVTFFYDCDLSSIENSDVEDNHLMSSFENISSLNNRSSFVKDFEDNVTFFYDCDLSSIENSDVEDNHLMSSFENISSLNNRSFEINIDLTESTKYSSLNDQSKFNKKKKLNLSSESCDIKTFMEYHNSSIDSSNDYKYYKNLSGNTFKKQNHNESEGPVENNIQCSVNPSIKSCKLNSKDNPLEKLNYSNVKTISNCLKSEFSNIDKKITVDIDTLYEDLPRNYCNTEMYQNSESKKCKTLGHRDISDERLDLDKSISSSPTSSKSSKNLESESLNQFNVKTSSSSKVPKFSNIVDTIDTIQSDSACVEQNNLSNDIMDKLDEILDEDDSASPFILQSAVKTINTQNHKKALEKKAITNLSFKNMGDKALCTYLTQKTMVLDVLKILLKSLDTLPLPDVLMEDPKGLVVPLMPHQKHAIAWLMWRESQKPCGGILADDMGLGKTLSMISLVLKAEEKQTSEPDVSNDNIVHGGTLVVCPAALLNQWENEVRIKLSPGLLKFGQYYGLNRNTSASELAKNDIVTTSYHVIMWDFKKQQNSSPLFKINWKRIILDEAHIIRNHKTQTCLAVCNLTSTYRWAITGTPIHNKEADFFTLLKFIRCKPFDDWKIWKRWVSNIYDIDRHTQSLLVKALMLRRTKEDLSQLTSFKLPSKNFSTIEIELSKEERNAYEQLLKFSCKLFATYLYEKAAKEKAIDHNIKIQCTVQYFQEQSKKKEKIFKDHPELQKLFKQFQNIEEVQTYHILVLLLRLRQMCCHPCLIKGKVTDENIDSTTDIDAIDNASCNDNSIIVPSVDLGLIEELSNSMSCLTLNEFKCNRKNKLIDCNLIFKKSWLSSKIKAVCDMVREKVLIDGCKEKAIIVSQWPNMLHIIKQHLSQYNYKMEMYTGDVSILKRDAIVHEFNNINGGPQILLMSLNAGGVGLNLMAANHMFLVDFHWNPQLEAQACDRIYRLGQTKPVNIYKFICKNTIETRILMIQSQKLEIAQTLLEGVKVNSSNITLDDLKLIFKCT